MHPLDFDTLHVYGTDKYGVEVPVTLRLGQNTVRFPARLDTGATFCVFERGYAETLGLTVETGSQLRFSTVMGSFDAFGHLLTLETLGYSFDVTVYFAADESFTFQKTRTTERRGSVFCLQGGRRGVLCARNVLGRRGWLDQVRLGIVEYEGKLSRYDRARPATDFPR